MKQLLLIVFLINIATNSWAQAAQGIPLSLDAIIQKAQANSIAVKQASTLKETRFWEWRNFKANYKPQVSLSGTIPGFTRNSIQVVQQTGTIDFKSVAQNNINLGLSLSQPLALTGGTLFMSTSLQRFDDFDQDFTLYNGAPIQLGFIQPILNFNRLKWDKKIEPLRYKESQQAFIVEMETIARNAVDFFFRQIIAQIDQQIARTNVENTDTIYQITLEKFNLGKVSQNDLLQLRMEKLKAAKALALAEQDLEIYARQLKSYIGDRQNEAWKLALPNQIPNLYISEKKAVEQAFKNRPDGIGFKRRAIEAQRAIAQAKGSTGFSAELIGSFGLSKSDSIFSQVYNKPQDQQGISLTFSIPIIDWGRAKSQIETAKANKQLALYEIEQDQIDLEQSILTEIRLIERFQKQLQLSLEADEVAQLRYTIAQDRFILGDLSITDLSIALQEKDNAKRDYVRSVWDYWSSYYRIRALCLFDFEKNTTIHY